MKPIELTMEAFGSYGKRTTIRFDNLEQNLFLICGKTGSGKSTIFDAIVFALYGPATKAAASVTRKAFLSQFSDGRTVPTVMLKFSTQSGIYTVTRTAHYTPAERKTPKPEAVSLLLPDGTEYPGKREEVNSKLEQLVGLTRDQFLQVAMIAQGDFIRLLKDSSDDKQKVFSKLFGTGIYSRIDEVLKEKCAEKGKVCKAAEAGILHSIRSIRIPEGCSGDLAELQQRICEPDSAYTIVDLEQMMELLDAMRPELRTQLKVLQEALTQASQNWQARHDAVTRAQGLLEQFERLKNAEELLLQYEKQAPVMAEKEALAARIDAAYTVKAAFEQYDSARARHGETVLALAAQEARLPDLTAAAEQADADEKAARTDSEKHSSDFAALKQKIGQALELFEKIETAREALREGETRCRKARLAAEKANAGKEALEQEIQEKSDRRDALSDARLRRNTWTENYQTACRLAAELAGLTDESRSLEALQRDYEEKQGEYLRLNREYREVNNRYVSVREAYFNAQAGLLARERLEEGKPCPVCGSLCHPAPCVLTEEQKDLTREKVDALSAQSEELNRRSADAAQAASQVKGQLDSGRRHLEQSLENLEQQVRQSVPGYEEQAGPDAMTGAVEEWKRSLEGQEDGLNALVSELEETEEFLRNSGASRKALKEEADRASEDSAETAKELSRRTSALETLEKQVTYTDAGEARQLLADAEKQKEAAAAVHQSAIDAQRKAASNLSNCKALIEQFRRQIPLQEEEAGSRLSDYRDAIAHADLAEDQWQDLTVRYDREAASTLRDEIQKYREQKAGTEGIRRAAREAIGAAEKPDPDVLIVQEKQAEALLEGTRDRVIALDGICRSNEKLTDDLNRSMEAYSRLRREYGKLSDLYRSLHGSNTGARMDIETFVQRYYLRSILASANRRFENMSGGQFQLRMTDEVTAGTGKNRGLDLMVYSTVTGKIREAESLSGGESFMAALALALGMADQIQQSSAAVQLDMMFIDEGFGSLDSDAREEAVRVLQNMAGGSKLVGIISHVSELKQAIDDQLIVTKDDKGSHVRWN